MAKRRRKPTKGEAEIAALPNRRWCLLDEQRRLETLNHTAAENDAARPSSLPGVSRRRLGGD